VSLAQKRGLGTDGTAREVIDAARICAVFERRPKARRVGSHLAKDTTIAIAVVGLAGTVTGALGSAAGRLVCRANAIASHVPHAVRSLGMVLAAAGHALDAGKRCGTRLVGRAEREGRREIVRPRRVLCTARRRRRRRE